MAKKFFKALEKTENFHQAVFYIDAYQQTHRGFKSTLKKNQKQNIAVLEKTYNLEF